MNTSIKTIAVVGLLSMITVSQVAAVDLRGIRQDLREETREEKSDRDASRPGLLNKFANVNKGKSRVGRVTLTAKNGSTLTVKDKDGKTLTVNTDDKTQFRRQFWGKSSLSELSVNDKLDVIGQWTDDAHTIILARLVRDVSINKRFGVFFGTVTTVNGTGWVMNTIGRGTQTVTVSSTTKLVNRREQPITKADVLVGHRVRVKGLWDSINHTITDVEHVKDFAIPVVAKGTPTVTPAVTSTPAPTVTPGPTATPTLVPTSSPTPTPTP